jgi:hypothetical protein
LAASGDGEIPRNFSQSEELFVPEFLPELRRNTVYQLTDNGFLCDITGHIGLFRPEKFIDIHYGTHGIQEVSGSIPLISTKNNKPQGFRPCGFVIPTGSDTPFTTSVHSF